MRLGLGLGLGLELLDIIGINNKGINTGARTVKNQCIMLVYKIAQLPEIRQF